MSYKKQKPSKATNSKPHSQKNNKDEFIPKDINNILKRKKNYDLDDSSVSNQGNNGSRIAKKQKAKLDARSNHSTGSDDQLMLKKLIDYDEFEEINDFLKTLDKVPQKPEKKEQNKF